IGETGATAMAKVLGSNPSCKIQIGDAEATALAKALESNSSLISLDLNINCIGDTGAAALAKALGSLCLSTRIKLFPNFFGFKCQLYWRYGGEALAKALESNSSLTLLKLGGSYIR